MLVHDHGNVLLLSTSGFFQFATIAISDMIASTNREISGSLVQFIAEIFARAKWFLIAGQKSNHTFAAKFARNGWTRVCNHQEETIHQFDLPMLEISSLTLINELGFICHHDLAIERFDKTIWQDLDLIFAQNELTVLPASRTKNVFPLSRNLIRIPHLIYSASFPFFPCLVYFFPGRQVLNDGTQVAQCGSKSNMKLRIWAWSQKR